MRAMRSYTSSSVLVALLWIQAEAVFFNLPFTATRNRPGLCFNCQCGRSNGRTARLIGGTTVSTSMYPWIAAVYVNDQTYSGALISSMHVLTALSPVSSVPTSAITVGLGVGNRCTTPNSGLNTSVSSVTPAPGGVDMAVLTLSGRIPFSETIRHICLPPFTTSAYQGQVASIVSWGPASENATGNITCTPRQIGLPILPAQSCTAAYAGTVYTTSNANCAGVQGTPSLVCSTDAGGIVQYDNGVYDQLIGILPDINRCTNSTNPAVYVRTAPLLTWLLTTTKDSCYCTAY